jgi:hypothetical protein
MPPDPWKLLRTDELTDDQAISLEKKLLKRQNKLAAAMAKLEQALHLLSSALDQEGYSGTAKKTKRKKVPRKRKSKH